MEKSYLGIFWKNKHTLARKQCWRRHILRTQFSWMSAIFNVFQFHIKFQAQNSLLINSVFHF